MARAEDTGGPGGDPGVGVVPVGAESLHGTVRGARDQPLGAGRLAAGRFLRRHAWAPRQDVHQEAALGAWEASRRPGTGFWYWVTAAERRLVRTFLRAPRALAGALARFSDVVALGQWGASLDFSALPQNCKRFSVEEARRRDAERKRRWRAQVGRR